MADPAAAAGPLPDKPPVPEGYEEPMQQPEAERQEFAKHNQLMHHKKKPVWKPPTYTISDAFRMFCRRTNGHGWIRIIRAPTMKGTVIWFMLTFLFFGFGVVYTATLWSRFVRYDVEISLKSQIGRQPFPAVTVCSNNPIKLSAIKDAKPDSYRDKLMKVPENINRLMNTTIYYTHKLKAEALDPRYEAYKDIVAAAEDTTLAQRRALSYNATELVLYCSYDGVVCDFSEPTVKHYFDQDFGNCYTWTAPAGQEEKEAGIEHGLHLILNISTEEYLPFFTDAEGMKIDIHQTGRIPLPLGYGKSAPAGFEMEFGLSTEQFDRLAEPYNDPGCVEDHDNFKELYGFDYSQRGCQYTCRQMSLIKNCSCMDFREPHAKGHKFCDDTDRKTIACMEAVDISFRRNPQSHCFCPPACVENRYTTQASLSRWPAVTFEDSFQKAYGFSHKNTASVRVYFRSPVTIIYTEIPRESAVQFLGWLGGQLSVWTGASLITVIEFIMFLLTSALVLFTENVDWLLEDKNTYLY